MSVEGPLVLLGRLLLTAIFLFSAAGKAMNWAGTATMMTGKGVALVPDQAALVPNLVPVLLAGAIAFEVVGGLSVLLGFKARLGAILLILFIIPAALIFHDFWRETDAQKQQDQMIHFMKNVAILGGLLIVLARGAGPWSIDNRGRS